MWKIFKKKQIINFDHDNWEDILSKMSELLEANKHFAQARYVDQVLESIMPGNELNFRKRLNSIEMWGGSGAVWEVGFSDSREDGKEFQIQVIKLVELMKRNKISHSKANTVAQVFRKENRIS